MSTSNYSAGPEQRNGGAARRPEHFVAALDRVLQPGRVPWPALGVLQGVLERLAVVVEVGDRVGDLADLVSLRRREGGVDDRAVTRYDDRALRHRADHALQRVRPLERERVVAVLRGLGLLDEVAQEEHVHVRYDDDRVAGGVGVAQ